MGMQDAVANFKGPVAAVTMLGLGAVAQFRARLNVELDQGLSRHRSRLRARRLSVAFSKIPAELSKPEWLESEIILKSLSQTNAKRVHQQLGALKLMRDCAGQADAFDAFITILTEAHGIRLPTFHGYSNTFADMDATAIMSQMGAMMAMLQGHGLTVFANSGTLLGLVRDGALLPHDDDIDLAVVLKAKTQEAAAVEWAALRKQLGALGLLAADDLRFSPAIMKLRRIDGVTVDLFPAWFDANGQTFVYPHTKGDLPKSAVMPLVAGPCKGIKQPRLAKQMLALNYGQSWKIPDPTFRFPWDAANTFFKPFLGALTNEGH